MKYLLIICLLFSVVFNIMTLNNDNDDIKLFLDNFKEWLLDRNKSSKDFENFFTNTETNKEVISKLLKRDYFKFDYQIKDIINTAENDVYDVKVYLDQKYYSGRSGTFKLKTNKTFRLSVKNGEIRILFTDIAKGLPIVLLLVIILGSILITVVSILIFIKFFGKIKVMFVK